MQNIENDMDDLFRRAAENYPLNTGKGDWDKIDKKLAVPAIEDKTQRPAKSFNYKKLLFLLLLLSSIAAIYIFNSGPDKYLADSRVERNNRQAVSKEEKINPNATVNQSPVKTYVENKKAVESEKAEIKKTTAIDKLNTGVTSNAANFNQNGVSKEAKVLYTQMDQPKTEKHNQIFNSESKTEKSDEVKKDNSLKETTENKSVVNSIENSSLVLKKKTKTSEKSANEKRWYAELVSDIDFNKVKSTHFEGPAFGIGLMGGYQVNKHFFFETGLISFRKNYYSLGDAFYEKGASMPSGMIINDLESRSKILEIPIKAGFYFYDSKKIKYFVAAGASAYIMMNERNNYNVTMNGTPEKMVGVYQKNDMKIPAVLNISTGLQHNITGSLKIIIEPYLKLPLQGIGVGKLPVTSAGIQIGILGTLK